MVDSLKETGNDRKKLVAFIAWSYMRNHRINDMGFFQRICSVYKNAKSKGRTDGVREKREAV